MNELNECVDCWVDVSVDEWNNTFHVPTEQNIDPVSQSVPLTDCNCRLIANLYDDADFTPQVIYDVRTQPRTVSKES
jgi:hypothetical protein